jgi:arginyl-tRNA synthetase
MMYEFGTVHLLVVKWRRSLKNVDKSFTTDIIKVMENKINKIIEELFNVNVNVAITRPDPQFGDYATNVALQIAKQVSKSPREDTTFSEVTIAGPGFINIRVTAKYLANLLEKDWTNSYGENQDGAGKTVVVEYPSPNVAKPYSIGHLRPSNQGWAAKRLMEVTGWHVITDSHIGDYGAPFGVWVVGFLNFSSEEALAEKGVYELGRVYIEAKKALKDEEERGENKLALEVQDWLLRLEKGDEQAKKYSKKFNDISLAHIHKVMDRLKIATEYEYGEAFFAPRGKDIVKKLVDEGVAVRNDDGSIIASLDEFDTPVLLQKSNGGALYATTDLATIFFREEEWHPDRVIYVVGSEQQFYFQQLFALAKKLGIYTEMIHLWFGIIDQINENGVREKMSSRKGVVLMEELLDTAEMKAKEIVGDRGISENDIKKIALGAIKFTDFTADRRTNILFDWKSIFALTGFSGPYVQYAAVRVNKILDSSEVEDVNTGSYAYESEKMLFAKLLEYPAVVHLAARDLEPHKVASYTYELARELNRYYEQTPIVTGEVTAVEKRARIEMLKKVKYVFTHALSILGIEVPTAM